MIPLISLLQGAEAAPTTQAAAAIAEARQTLAGHLAKWKALQAQDVPELNAKLKAAGLAVLEIKE
jgi:hypothetical protein